MISIIISSVNPEHLKAISKNIAETVGVPFEIIGTNNNLGEKGICQVYNEGAAKAKYDILCFIHEDINIITKNWGDKLVSLFNDPKLGLVGVAGSGYLPIAPSAWGNRSIDTGYINIIQSFKYHKKKPLHSYRNPKNEQLSTVACVDGVWLATTKAVFNEFTFDEQTFKGFHGYDIDFSLSVGTKYRVAVTFELLINHFSEGSFDKTWLEENVKVYSKWNKQLPVNIDKLSAEQIFVVEKVTFKHFIDELVLFGSPMILGFKILWKNNRILRLNANLFFKLKFYLIKKCVLPRKQAMVNQQRTLSANLQS